MICHIERLKHSICLFYWNLCWQEMQKEATWSETDKENVRPTDWLATLWQLVAWEKCVFSYQLMSGYWRLPVVTRWKLITKRNRLPLSHSNHSGDIRFFSPSNQRLPEGCQLVSGPMWLRPKLSAGMTCQLTSHRAKLSTSFPLSWSVASNHSWAISGFSLV